MRRRMQKNSTALADMKRRHGAGGTEATVAGASSGVPAYLQDSQELRAWVQSNGLWVPFVWPHTELKGPQSISRRILERQGHSSSASESVVTIHVEVSLE